MMRTDIKDLGNVYEMTMNLPGVKKENVKAKLKDGYRTVSAVSAAQNVHQAGTLRGFQQQKFL